MATENKMRCKVWKTTLFRGKSGYKKRYRKRHDCIIYGICYGCGGRTRTYDLRVMSKCAPRKCVYFRQKCFIFSQKVRKLITYFGSLTPIYMRRWRRNWRQIEAHALICNNGFYHSTVNSTSAPTGTVRDHDCSSIMRV